MECARTGSVWTRRTTGSSGWDRWKGCLDAASSAVTRKFVVSTCRRNYFSDMRILTCSFSMRRLMALIMSLALMITGMAASAAMDHAGHSGDRHTLASAASDIGASGHEEHHMPAGASDAECCEPENTANSGCHVSACCLSELQHSEFPAATEYGRGACAQSMVSAPGPSVDTSLPERPPRLS